MNESIVPYLARYLGREARRTGIDEPTRRACVQAVYQAILQNDPYFQGGDIKGERAQEFFRLARVDDSDPKTSSQDIAIS